MRRLISVLLCFVLLSSLFACGRVEQPPVDPDPVPTVSPTPEQPTGEPDPVPTDSPTPEVTPPPEVIHTVDGYQIVYENEELDVTICSVDNGSRIVVHYGELTQEIENFPYNDMRPDFQVWEQDGDGDEAAELYIVHEVGSGTGESVCMLLACEPNGDTLECLTHDWSEIAEEFNKSRVASYDKTTGLVSVTYGERAVAAAADPGLNCKDPAAIFGNQVHYFRNEDGTVGLTFALELISEDHPMPEFYGMSLFLSLQFDGTDMIPVTKPQLGLDYGAKFAFSVTPTGVNKEFPDNFYETFLLNTPVGERSFTGCHVIGGNPIELYLADLTGDGADEFIVMLLPGWGSGPVKHDLHVFDGITLEEYDYNGTWSFLPELTAFTSDENHYYIDAANLLIPIAKKDVQALFPDTELLDTMEFRGEMCSLSAAYGKLFVTNWCMVTTWDTYGTLSASLVVKDGELTVDEVFYTAPNGTVTNERLIKDYFRAQLSGLNNWYLAAMGSVFDTPAAMDLGLVFYNGFSDNEDWWSYTPEEEAYLLEQGFWRHIAVQKRPAEQLDEILNKYFGISLYDAAIPADWVYYPETDCYYSCHGDAYLVHGFTVMDVRETEDGLIEVHYCVDPLHGAFDPVTGWPISYGILTLRSNSGALISSEGYTVISNLPAAPIDALAEEGVFLYALPDGSLILQDEYTAGPVTYVNDTNANHPGCYDLSQITITRKEFLHDWEGEPLYGVILLNLASGETAENVELRWVEETGTWEISLQTSNQPYLGGEVTRDTIPTDPKQFYRVANCGVFALYARNHGQESLMTWEGNFWWYLGERTAHTRHFNLPVMVPMTAHYEGVIESVAVISEVQTGTQTGVDELIVYQVTDIPQENGTIYTALNEFIYDWRPIAEEFNRNNTIVYDKETNSLTLFRNGEAYFTGTLSNNLSTHLELEDGFTGALIASGQIVRIEANEDGSFTVTMQTCIGKGGDGSFSEDLSDPFWHRNGEENDYNGMAVGITGFELSWTVNFTGEGFEASDVTVAQTGGETVYLKAAIPSEGIYLFRGLGGGAGGCAYLLADGEITLTAGQDGFGDLISDFRLCDLDGDGEEELAVVGNFYAGAGYTSILTILDKTENGWSGCRFFPAGTASELMETAVFMPGADSNHVILSLEGFQFMFEVSNEVAARDGAYFASGAQLSTAITWDGEGYVLHLPGQIYRSDSSIEGFYPSACEIYFELRCELNYDGRSITHTPVGIMPPYTHFTVNQRGSSTFELVSEQGVVLFEGTHLPGEEIITVRRDLDLDGTEEFIVLLTSGRSDTGIHQDAYVFDGRTMEQLDTSGLWNIGRSLFVFFADDEMFHIHSGTFRQPLYKKDILARYPDIEFLDKVEFWGNRSSLSVSYDYIEISYDCIVGEGGESFGSLQVHLKVEDGQLVPFRVVYAFDGRTNGYQLASNPIPGPYIGE